MVDDTESLKANAREARSRARQARNEKRQRPQDDEALHTNENNLVAKDNLSQEIAVEAHGIDLTQDATEWRRYSNLDAPKPRPGYRQRWIRVRLVGKTDASNVFRQMREGWRPRKAETLDAGHSLPTIQLSQFGECIGVEDMILCEMPEKVFQQMRAYYRKKRKQQTASTETEMESLSRKHDVPIYRGNRTKVGSRPPVSVADD